MSDKVELTAPLGFLIMHEISKGAENGTQIAQRIGARKGTGVLTPGTIYPALKDLHRKRLVRYRTSGREKLWGLSESGEVELEELYREFSQLFHGLKHKIRSARKPSNTTNQQQ